MTDSAPAVSTSFEIPRAGRLMSTDGPRGRVLFVQHCAKASGSTISGRLLVEGLMADGWVVDAAFGFEGPYATEYEQSGCSIHVIEHKSWLRGGGIGRFLVRLARQRHAIGAFIELIKKLRPDVVYVNSLVSLAAAIAAKRRGVPVVWHLRELFDDVGGEMCCPEALRRPLVRRLIRKLPDRIITISNAVAENVLGTAFSGSCSIISNAVDESYFTESRSREECRRLFGLPPQGTIIGVVGGLRSVKGHEFFLQAAARIANEAPDCIFALAGDGPTEFVGSLKSQVLLLGLEQQVSFLGAVRNIREFYRACDVICVPSRSESFGRTVIEAFACGVPVVASAVGGIRETVKDGETGLLVEYGDVHGLAERLGRLLKDASLRQHLAKNAKVKAEREYRVELYQQRVNSVVEKVSADRKNRLPQQVCSG